MAKFLYLIFVAIMALVFMIGASPLSAQEGEIIQSLKIVGNKRIDESTILYYIQSKPGTVLSKSKIGKDIEQIFSLGQFKDIQVNTQDGIEGLELQFIVEEIPSIGDVEITGNAKVDANDIREKIIEQVKVIQTRTEFENSPCSSCKSTDIGVTDQDIIDYLSLLATKTGTKIEVISGVSEHGSMVINLGNIGAILRYNPNYTS